MQRLMVWLGHQPKFVCKPLKSLCISCVLDVNLFFLTVIWKNYGLSDALWSYLNYIIWFKLCNSTRPICTITNCNTSHLNLHYCFKQVADHHRAFSLFRFLSTLTTGSLENMIQLLHEFNNCFILLQLNLVLGVLVWVLQQLSTLLHVML